jgi:hypothetical protein
LMTTRHRCGAIPQTSSRYAHSLDATMARWRLPLWHARGVDMCSALFRGAGDTLFRRHG